MFIENAFLLLASSWMFTMVSWDTVGIPAAVFCSFLIGKTHYNQHWQPLADTKAQWCSKLKVKRARFRLEIQDKLVFNKPIRL